MVESQALQLVLGAAEVNDSVTRYLSKRLKDKGYQSATASTLSFLSKLECGDNYGSEIARNLGVSRQMVAKTIKELSRAGYLEQVDDVGKQKKILFTATGEQLISDARQILADIEKFLVSELGERTIMSTTDTLKKIQHVIAQLG